MTRIHKAQVLVVGGGPAGCSCAIELAKAGLTVRLIEAQTPSGKAGEVIPPSALADIEELGLSCDMLAKDHLRCSGVDRVWGSDMVARVDYTLQLGSGWHLDRQLFEQALLDQCRASGVAVHTGVALRDFDQTEDGWKARLNDDTELAATFLVDASGRRAVVAGHLKIRNIVQDRLMAFHTTLKDDRRTIEQSLFIEAVESGWWYTAPLPRARRVFAFMTDSDLPAAHRAARAEGFMSLLRETRLVSCFLTNTATDRPQAWTATSRRLRQFCGAGWLAVGDAAIGRDPLSGGGIAQALLQGRRAAIAVTHCLKIGVASFAEYEGYLRAMWNDHETERMAMYRGEQRWPWSPFWGRRSRIDPAALEAMRWRVK